MGDDTNDEKAITVRCSKEFRQLVKIAAAASDLSMSEYIRKTMRSTAKDDLGPEMIEEAKRKAAEDTADEATAQN